MTPMGQSFGGLVLNRNESVSPVHVASALVEPIRSDRSR
jgi:hypothetical protein